jgi:Fe-S-cluster containining protein
MIATRTFASKYSNTYVSLGLHAFMLILWTVSLGLTADLAHEWNPQCSYTAESGKICSSYAKRDTTFRTYFGALVASAVLIGLEM